jgi:hypothetical protein
LRDKLRALYYPDFWFEYPTLIKSILLFDEVHLMDRPSFMFGGTFGSIGMASPLRHYEESFRKEGVPLYVHQSPDGIVHGEMLENVEADLADIDFMTRFQEGLRVSSHFRGLHIAPGNYGNGETHETIFQKVAAIDLQQSPSSLEIFNDPKVRHLDHSTLEGQHKILASQAAICSAKMNFALGVGVEHGFEPLADAAPYATLLSAKYKRSIASQFPSGRQIPSTDLSLAIFDEFLPNELVTGLNVQDAITLRKESESTREAFLEHLSTLQAKIGAVPADGNYTAAIESIIATEIRPGAREYRNELVTIREKLVGKVVQAAIGWACSPAVLQFLGDVTWNKLLGTALVAGGVVAAETVGAHVGRRAVRRDCAISYLLDIEQKTKDRDKL